MKEPENGVCSLEVHELYHDPGDKLGDNGGRRRRRRLRRVRHDGAGCVRVGSPMRKLGTSQ